jgi:hypothetical protein
MKKNEEICEKPCVADSPCPNCMEYWNRIVSLGYWENGKWTDKAIKEMAKGAGRLCFD